MRHGKLWNSILIAPTPRRTSPHDKTIGARVRARRCERGLSQTELGDKIGVTFQQVQKYELGKNRVSASRITQIAEALQVSVGYLLGEDETKQRSDEDTLSISRLRTFGAVRLFKAFEQIKGRQARMALINIAEQMVRRSSR